MKNLVIGVLAHVDAGKTTLSEAILYKTGGIKKLGRVDRGDAFLDTDKIEKKRGITVFSKQAVFKLGEKTVYLQDTPGHADFSSEMERCLDILDYAVLVISAPDGIQSHTELLIDLLEKHSVPVFAFINKTDLKCEAPKLPDNWIDFNNPDYELAALFSDSAAEELKSFGKISDETLRQMIKDREIVPCYYGSALKLEGIEEFLQGLDRFAVCPEYPDELGAKCFKITRDSDGTRLSWCKITGGGLSVKDTVGEEKIDRIRIYSGSRYETVKTAESGAVCALEGLEKTFAGMGLGFEEDMTETSLEPVLTYRIRILDGTDRNTALKKLSELSEEDPLLDISWDPELSEIKASLMGEVQTEVLRQLIEDRYGIEVSIEEGRVVYKETINAPIEGVGHFEPLRHYAEVHLLMEPLPPGSGIVLETACSEDVLDRNWQRLVLYNLAEYRHRGVLTGALLTDIKITLIAGRAHLKHTEGGDFRQASLRAVRNGLMKAENVLLEPFYRFRADLPADQLGRAISDFKAMGGTIDAPENFGDNVRLSGLAPVSELSTYQTSLLSYTRGRGRLTCRYAGYYPCHNADTAVRQAGYDPDRDTENPSSSIFCSHGSGIEVKWNHVDDFAHMDSGLKIRGETVIEDVPKLRPGNIDFDERELEEIMQREFGAIKRPKYSSVVYEPEPAKKPRLSEAKKEYLIVDGYNMVFAWKSLKKLAQESISAARESLIDILTGFKARKGCEMVLVFDGYKLRGNEGTKAEEGGINIVYTKESQSADSYIEALVHKLGHSYNVSVASSDSLIQLTALQEGTRRMSARELEYEVEMVRLDTAGIIEKHRSAPEKLGDMARLIRD